MPGKASWKRRFLLGTLQGVHCDGGGVLGRGGICVYSLAWEQKGGMNMGRWKGTQP